MNLINVRNVHRVLPIALQILHDAGETRDSRNGPVKMISPVTTQYERPCERVIFWAERDANPFFHFFESLWMLGGKRDVASVSRFAANMANFSDNGTDFYGAYGFRWREGMPGDISHGPHDQLSLITNLLKQDRNDRRCVLQMWDGQSDLGWAGKDVPCNTTATFQIDSSGRLNMCVFNRSNDIIWGAYGANAVHFSMLLEYMARRIGVEVGTYHQISVNWHGYLKTYLPLYEKMLADKQDLTELIQAPCPYALNQVEPYRIMDPSTDASDWDISLQRLLSGRGRAPTEGRWSDPFFVDVAIPILRAHDLYKETTGEARYVNALQQIEHCSASDWRTACSEWLTRRWVKWQNEGDAT